MPLATFHKRTLWSPLPEANTSPFGENARQRTGRECPWSVAVSWHVLAFHTRIVMSSPPDAIRAPSGEKTTQRTLPR